MVGTLWEPHHSLALGFCVYRGSVGSGPLEPDCKPGSTCGDPGVVGDGGEGGGVPVAGSGWPTMSWTFTVWSGPSSGSGIFVVVAVISVLEVVVAVVVVL